MLSACGGGDDASSGGSSATDASRWSSRKSTTPTTSTTTTPTTSTGTTTATAPGADAIFDASGNLNASEYVAIASDYSSDKAIAYRYGASNSAAAAVQTYWKPSDKTFYPHGNTCDGGQDTSTSIIYQLGGIDCGQNDYGSNMGDVIYRSDNASDPGVTPLLSLDLSAGVITEKPQPAWFYNNATTDPQLQNHIPANGGVLPTQPIAMGRCLERDCAQALVAFQNGLIANVGSNTASHSASVKLPAGKVPTAIAITTNSEFALVTIWDTVNLKGQVAVIALGSISDGSQVGGPYDTNPAANSMSWPGLYPGLRNVSDFVFMKLLGFVDLPGMVAPTDISATTDFSVMQDDVAQGWLFAPGGTDPRKTMTELNPATSQANQKSFAAGGSNANLISRSGVAAVISKSEKKVVFLNLKPLFDKVNNTYFDGSFAGLQSALSNTGLGDTQWPQTFATDNYAPTVVTTMSLAARPTAVQTSILANPGQAWVATEDGVIHSISVAGVQSGTNLDPALIKEVTSLQVGKNPTSMVHHPNVGLGNSNTQMWVVSRGEQKVQLVDMGTMTIEKTLQDSRIVDPITVSETQQSPLLTSVITLTDYAGKQVMNYRYAPISLQGGNTPLNIGIGQTGNDLFEFGGAYAVAGKPFNYTQSNVP
ncbi:hypothetical protein [Cupriavidus necator]|nr:hypothetical protein [Cupriavidus necator]